MYSNIGMMKGMRPMTTATLPMKQPASVQMNVRLNSALKKRGDSALASMGYAPSDAVRAVWTLANGGPKELDQLKATLDSGRALGTRKEAGYEEASDDLLDRGWSLYGEALEQVGLSLSSVLASASTAGSAATSDEELLEQALWERLEERGLA